MRYSVVGLVALGLWVGCGDDDVVGEDAGRDASTPPDSGGDIDAGPAPDGGVSDAGVQCASHDECAATEFCAAATCESDGRCTQRPDACPEIIEWVCGCDGTSYTNSCEANAAGVNVASRGRCEGEGDAGMSMSCTDNAECMEGYCAKAMGDCEGMGACTPRPQICPRIVDEHCGCDGMTYTNDCIAASAGVNVVARGECSTSCDLTRPPGCCFEDSHCGLRSQRCVNAACVADGAGVCVTALLAAGECWETSDCPLGSICDGATICECGVRCRDPNSPGLCRRRAIRE